MNIERLMVADQRPPQVASNLEDAPRLVKGGQPLSVVIVEDERLVAVSFPMRSRTTAAR